MYPIFVSDNPNSEEDISALPGQKRWGVNKLQGFLAPLVEKGLKSVILFGVPLTMPKVRIIIMISEMSIIHSRVWIDQYRMPEALWPTLLLDL